MTRYWYAQRHLYDVRFQNDLDVLYRFESKQWRDEFVEDCQLEEMERGNIVTESCTRDEARANFPHAFSVYSDFAHAVYGKRDARDWEYYDEISWCWCADPDR